MPALYRPVLGHVGEALEPTKDKHPYHLPILCKRALGCSVAMLAEPHRMNFGNSNFLLDDALAVIVLDIGSRPNNAGSFGIFQVLRA
jgi:hypothetical protein